MTRPTDKFAEWIESRRGSLAADRARRLACAVVAAGDAAAPERKRKRIEVTRDPNALLTAAQVAARLAITVEQLMAHVGDGAIRSINIGRGKKKPRYRFDPADIDAFKTSRRTLEQSQCPSSSRKSPRHTIGSASKSNVVGFSALRTARLAKKPSGSKR
jgi:hypothetical protein